MLGIPRSDQPSVSQWCHVMFERNTDGTATERAFEAGYAIRSYLEAMAEARRTEPGDDLMTHIARSTIDGVPLTDNEILGMTLLIYAAGNETTSMLIGNALWLLDQHPEERERLRAVPAAIPAALEEMLRFEAPVSHQARMTTCDVEIQGVTIPKGKRCCSCTARQIVTRKCSSRARHSSRRAQWTGIWRSAKGSTSVSGRRWLVSRHASHSRRP